MQYWNKCYYWLFTRDDNKKKLLVNVLFRDENKNTTTVAIGYLSELYGFNITIYYVIDSIYKMLIW